MIDRQTEDTMAQLRERLQQTCGREMRTPRDFDFLSESIYGTTHEMVNCSTLKRIFGYIKGDVVPRMSTRDVLCRYVGFPNWNSFCAQNGHSESALVVSDHLYADEMFCGERLRVLWRPDRVMEITHLGKDVFRIDDVQNSKLVAGNTFRCPLFIQNEPLFLSDVTGLAVSPVSYVCGQDHGIVFQEV